MTTKYVTVKHLAEVFHRSPQTIWRWIDEGRPIKLGEDVLFEPSKDPAGCWLFKVVIVRMEGGDGNGQQEDGREEERR